MGIGASIVHSSDTDYIAERPITSILHELCLEQRTRSEYHSCAAMFTFYPRQVPYLETINQTIAEIIAYLPTLIGALLILLAGYIIGRIVGEDRSPDRLPSRDRSVRFGDGHRGGRQR